MTHSNQGGHPFHAYTVLIDNEPYTFNEPIINRGDILSKANKNPPACFSVYQGLEDCDFRLIKPGDEIDLKNIGKERFFIKEPVTFHYTVNKEPEISDQKEMTPRQILKAAGIDPAKEYLVLLLPNKPEVLYAWDLDTAITMHCAGMHFITRPWVDTADIEQLGKDCKPVPAAKHYRVKIQNAYYLVDSPFMTKEQVIALAGKPDPQKWDVLKFLSNQAKPIKIGKEEVIDLLQPCILRFILQPKEQTEGKEVRRQFTPLSEDLEFLQQQNLLWEALLHGNSRYIIIHDFPIPAGYNVNKAQVAIMLPPTYPAVQIDMAFFSPALHLTSGRQIGALTPCMIDGRNFQQWSRHRADGQWIAGVDNIATHMQLVENWLLKELNPKP